VQKLPHYFLRVTMLPVDGIVHLLHLGIGDGIGQCIENRKEFRMRFDQLCANDRHGLVRRKVVPIIRENE
jgi:hypothetical protein